MTLSEFKAWFEGYTEGLEAAPTKAQFDRIKEKVKEISGTPTTYPIYIDRYVNPFRQVYPQWSWTTSGGTIGDTASFGYATSASNAINRATGGSAIEPFDAHAAMYALGQAEALAA